MSREYPRSRRVGDQIQRELAELVRDGLKDPRAELVTITEVEVSRDLAHAKVYFGTLAIGADKDEVQRALNGAAGFLRRELAKRLRVRTVPELRFLFDKVLDEGARMDALIAAARRADEGK